MGLVYSSAVDWLQIFKNRCSYQMDESRLLRNAETISTVSSDDGTRGRAEVVSVTQPPRRYVPVEVYITLYTVASVVVEPLVKFYVYDIVAESYGVDDISRDRKHGSDKCPNLTDNGTFTDIQRDASTNYMYLSLTSGIPAIVPCLIFGALMDKYGRKKILMLSLIGSLIEHLIYLAVVYWNLGMPLLYVGSCVRALTGGGLGVLMLAFGMVADLTKPGEERAFRIVLIEGIVSLTSGIILLIVGFAIQYAGYSTVALIGEVFSAINVVFTLFLIPETVPNLNTSAKLCTSSTFTKCFTIYSSSHAGKRRSMLIISFIAFAFAVFGVLGSGKVWTLFVLNIPFCWKQLHINIFLAVVCFLTWPAIFILVKLTQKKLKDTGLLVLGTLSGIAEYTILALAMKHWQLYGGALLSIFIKVPIPMLRSIMSRLVSAKDQGSLFGGLAAMETVSLTAANVALAAVYKDAVSYFPGLPFVILTLTMTLVLIFSVPLTVGANSKEIEVESAPDDGDRPSTGSINSR